MFDTRFEFNVCLNVADDELDYIFVVQELIVERSLGGTPYFPSIEMSNA